MKNYLIYKFLIVIYRRLYSLFQLIKWFIQTFYLRNRNVYSEVCYNDIKGKVLILAPHSDDEWIGCSQLMIDDSIDVTVCNMDMPGGDSLELHQMRREEMELVAHVCSREIMTLNEEKIKSLKCVIENVRPNFICLPFLIDWHSEHRKVMGFLSQLSLYTQLNDVKIIMYQVSVPIPLFFINYVKIMSYKRWRNKWSFFKQYYSTQTYIPYIRFSLNECVNSNITRRRTIAAEVFSIMSFSRWQDYYIKSSRFEERIKSLVNCISDLFLIRKRGREICDELLK